MVSGKPYPYPHKFDTTHTITEFINQFDSLVTEKAQTLDQIVTLGVRIVTLRSAGKSLIFYSVTQEGKKLQVILDFSKKCFL